MCERESGEGEPCSNQVGIEQLGKKMKIKKNEIKYKCKHPRPSSVYTLSNHPASECAHSQSVTFTVIQKEVTAWFVTDTVPIAESERACV